MATLESYGRSYARNTYGYNGTANCNPSNGAGYYPGIYVKITTMKEGYAAVKETVDDQYTTDIACGNVIYVEKMEKLNGALSI